MGRFWTCCLTTGFFLGLVFALRGLDYLLASTLRHLFFVSGWFVLATLMLFALSSFRPQQISGRLPPYNHGHTLIVLASVAFFGSHCDWGWPEGVYEILLLVLFLAVSIGGLGAAFCCAQGNRLVNKPRVLPLSSESPEVLIQREGVLTWIERRRFFLRLSIPSLVTILPLALFHGILSYAHGALARFAEILS